MREQYDVPVDPQLTQEAVSNNKLLSNRNDSPGDTGLLDLVSQSNTSGSNYLFEWCEAFQSPYQCETSANAAPEYVIPRFDPLGQEAFARGPRHYSPSTMTADRHQIPARLHSVLEKEAERSPGTAQQPERSSSISHLSSKDSREHNKQQDCPSTSADPLTTLMQTSLLDNKTAAPSRYYAEFSGTFRNPEHACDYRREMTRFDRKPYRPPNYDETLQDVANNRQIHVKRIYDAMIRPDAAQDNPGSIAMRRWVHSAYYPSALVEAYSHKVFDCLLKQAEEGFRGWHHNDYASDERKGSETEDKNLSCAERLNSIIHSLEQEKTVCEDVMNSACQIRMFVNAPRAYAARKSANRAGNSKRKKATDFPTLAPSRAPKTRRPNNTSMSKSRSPVPPSQSQNLPSRAARSAPTSSLHQLAAQTPRQQTEADYGNDPAAESFTQLRMPFMSPPYLHELAPRFTSAPPPHNSPFMSPPPLSLYSNSASATPEQPQNMAESMGIYPWSTAGDLAGPSECTPHQQGTSVDPRYWNYDNDVALFPDDGQIFQFDREIWNGLYSSASSNTNIGNIDPDLQAFCNDRQGVHSYPQGPLMNDDKK